MANEQALQCAKCGRITLHRASENVMKCNVCEPALAPWREHMHSLIWVAVAIGAVVAGLAVCTNN